MGRPTIIGVENMGDIYDRLLDKLKVIRSKAWLVSRFDEEKHGKVKPKITLRYFGDIILKKGKIYYEGSFMKIKKIRLVIPLRSVLQVNIFGGNHLRIKWIGKDRIIHNVLFQIGELGPFEIAHPSKRAAEIWLNLIQRAKERLKP